MSNYSNIDQDYRFWVLFRQTLDAILRAREKELSPYGISSMQAAALLAIETIGSKATPAEISRWLFREPHSVSTLLKRMEKQGLVSRTKDLHRKNLIRVSLTEKGQRAFQQAERRESIRKVMSSLIKEELQQLESYLERLRSEAFKMLVRNMKVLPL